MQSLDRPRSHAPRARALLTAAVLALGVSALAAAQAAPAAAAAPAHLAAVQQHYLALAEDGVALARRRWWDAREDWYDEVLGDRERYPLATIWGIVQLFESLDAIAIAQPTPPHLAAVRGFAAGAEGYLNRNLKPVPGYSPYPRDRSPDTETWFDDNGWWGIAFVNAYEATRQRRYLVDAERALHYIAAAGWDPAGGGIWWNTLHPYKAGEAIASGSLLAVLLYRYTGSHFALGQAQKFIAWANGTLYSPAQGLYGASNISSTPIDYIQAPLIYAQALLCHLSGTAEGCQRAGTLARRAEQRFGYLVDDSPQYDAIYLQWMLALASLEGERNLYEMAAENAARASSQARNTEGLYLLSWEGSPLPVEDAVPGMLQTQAATTSVFAWLAAYPPPA